MTNHYPFNTYYHIDRTSANNSAYSPVIVIIETQSPGIIVKFTLSHLEQHVGSNGTRGAKKSYQK